MNEPQAHYAHVTRNVNALVPFSKNARHHSEMQIAKLTRAISAFGFTNPLLIDDTDAVLAGYGRLMAARAVGMTDVPCIVVVGLSVKQKRALMLSDNRIALESTWSQDLLVEALGEISADGTDMALTGFEDFEIEMMLFPSAGFDDDPPAAADKKDKLPTIQVSVPSAIDIPSIAAIIRKAISKYGYKGVKVREPR